MLITRELKRGEAPLTKPIPLPLDKGLASNVILMNPSQVKDDEESVGGAGSAQIIPSTPRPFATLRVTWMQSFWGKANNVKKGIAEL